MNNHASEASPLFSLIHAAGVLQERMEAACERAGITFAKLGPLAVLLHAGKPLPLGEIANGVKCVRSNMTQLVDRLEADGLVKRTSDPDDRRVVRAELTALGRERARAATRGVEKVQQDFTASLSKSDRDAIARLLSAIS